jgi:arginine:agmatine antiporter
VIGHLSADNAPTFNPSGQSLFTPRGAGRSPCSLPGPNRHRAGRRWRDQRTARSTILGIAIAGVLYVLGTTVVMGVVPREQLMQSVAPFADAARIMWGEVAPSRSRLPSSFHPSARSMAGPC